MANIYGEATQIEETVSVLFTGAMETHFRSGVDLTVNHCPAMALFQLSTLRFASRMKRVRTDPALNEHINPVVRPKRPRPEHSLHVNTGVIVTLM